MYFITINKPKHNFLAQVCRKTNDAQCMERNYASCCDWQCNSFTIMKNELMFLSVQANFINDLMKLIRSSV
jgi:uncharacterized protein YdhG (YjbR/CyaY superfamily)